MGVKAQAMVQILDALAEYASPLEILAKKTATTIETAFTTSSYSSTLKWLEAECFRKRFHTIFQKLIWFI